MGSSTLAKPRAILATTVIWAALLFPSCDSQDIYSSQSQQQATANANARIQALTPAAGTYCGSVHLNKNDQDYQATLSLQIVEQNEHATTSQDPTDTVRVPMLGGALTFQVLSSQQESVYAMYPDLTQACGGYGPITFTYGDYSSVDHTVNLPFTLQGSTAQFGSLNGTLDGSAISGQWFSDSSQLVGTFDVSKCTPPTGGDGS